MQHQTTLPAAALKGAAHCAAKSDVRYYLNAVLVERTSSGKVLVAATDGNILGAQVVEQLDPGEGGAFQCLLPLDAVKALPKGGDVVLTFSREKGEAPRFSLSTGAAERGGLAVDGRFPDWRRVVPREASGEAAQFDPDLLARLQKAARTALGGSKLLLEVHHNGARNAALVGIPGRDEWIGVIMPMVAKHEPAPVAGLARPFVED